MTSSLIVLILTAISCSLLGVFLILRKISMLTDAISHTVLLGIVLTFFLVPDLSSPLLIVGAAAMGLLTVLLVETIGKKGISKYDDAIGMVFPILFSIAIILISKFFRNVHLDTDMVLLGEVLLFVILVFILSQYRKLKISTFDPEFAYLIGISTTAIFYCLMTLTSLSAVVSFNSVGAILVVSFFIGPSAEALLFTNTLKQTLIFASLIASINSIIGFFLAIKLNVSIAGFVASVNMVAYLVLLLIKKYTRLKKVEVDKDININGNDKSTKRRISNYNI